MKKWDWRHRDWLWVMLCIGLTFGTAQANDIQVLNLISYGSTFVSIALGFVAIYISVREATKSDNLKDDISVILGELKEKVGQVDNKVSMIDPQLLINKIVETTADKLNNESKSSDDNNIVINDEIKEELKKIMAEQLAANLPETRDYNRELTFSAGSLYVKPHYRTRKNIE